MRDIAEALKPYGFEGIISTTSIPGPGALIVTFWTAGSAYTACLTHDNQVVWVMAACCGPEVDCCVDDFNALHAKTRDLYRIGRVAA